jgi:hypothetical protein
MVYPRAVSVACYHAMVIALVKPQALSEELISDADFIGYLIDCYTNGHMDYPKGDPNN